jgi:diguanylate cyclase (GGDEF)-like protein
VDLIVDRRQVHVFLVLLRWLIFILIPLFILLSDHKSTTLLWWVVGIFGIYNLLLTVYIYYKSSRFISLFWVFVWVFDLLLITFAITQQDGIHSDIYNMFYLVIIQAGLLYAVRGAFFTSIFASIIYNITIYQLYFDFTDLKRALIRTIYFIVVGMLVGYLAKLETNAIVNSMTDYKTKLPNYKYFHERFQEELAKSSQKGGNVAVSIFDIDDFKSINSQFGHLVGDQILSDLARLLSLMKKDHDVMARYGGEEFVIMIPRTNEEDAAIRLEHIRQVIENFSFKVSKDRYIRITISLGLAMYNYPYIQSDIELLEQADKALADAKMNGKNRLEVWNSNAQMSIPL